jgi:hypothetical protein
MVVVVVVLIIAAGAAGYVAIGSNSTVEVCGTIGV